MKAVSHSHSSKLQAARSQSSTVRQNLGPKGGFKSKSFAKGATRQVKKINMRNMLWLLLPLAALAAIATHM